MAIATTAPARWAGYRASSLSSAGASDVRRVPSMSRGICAPRRPCTREGPHACDAIGRTSARSGCLCMSLDRGEVPQAYGTLPLDESDLGRRRATSASIYRCTCRARTRAHTPTSDAFDPRGCARAAGEARGGTYSILYAYAALPPLAPRGGHLGADDGGRRNVHCTQIASRLRFVRGYGRAC